MQDFTPTCERSSQTGRWRARRYYPPDLEGFTQVYCAASQIGGGGFCVRARRRELYAIEMLMP